MPPDRYSSQGHGLKHVTYEQFVKFLNRLNKRGDVEITESEITISGTEEAVINLAKSPIKFKGSEFCVSAHKADLPVTNVSPNGAKLYAQTMKRKCRVHSGVIRTEHDCTVIGLDRMESYRKDELIILEKDVMRQLLGNRYNLDDRLILAGKLKPDGDVVCRAENIDQTRDLLETESTDWNECAFSFRLDRVTDCMPKAMPAQAEQVLAEQVHSIPITPTASIPQPSAIPPPPEPQPAPHPTPTIKTIQDAAVPSNVPAKKKNDWHIPAPAIVGILGAAAITCLALLIRAKP